MQQELDAITNNFEKRLSNLKKLSQMANQIEKPDEKKPEEGKLARQSIKSLS